jgi:hypothetical protein
MSERRAHERQGLSTSWRTSFEYDGKERQAVMMDLSPRGAGLLLYQAEPFGLTAGDQLTLQTITPLGKSVCVAKVVWIDFVTAGIRFGVEFQEIAPTDPLLTYADSPF